MTFMAAGIGCLTLLVVSRDEEWLAGGGAWAVLPGTVTGATSEISFFMLLTSAAPPGLLRAIVEGRLVRRTG